MDLDRGDIVKEQVPRQGRVFFLTVYVPKIRVQIALRAALAFDDEREPGLVVHAAVFFIHVFVGYALTRFVVVPAAVLVEDELPFYAFSAFAGEVLVVEPAIVEGRIVEYLSHAVDGKERVLAVIPHIRVLFAVEADVAKVAVEFDLFKELVEGEGASSDAGHRAGYAYLAKRIIDGIIVCRMPFYVLAVLERPFADAQKTLGQGDAAKIVGPAERVVADMGHALADVDPADLPPVALPGLTEFVALVAFILEVLIDEVPHFAFALDMQGVAGLPMDLVYVVFLILADGRVVRVVMGEEAVLVFFQVPGHVLTAAALHELAVIDSVKIRRIVENVSQTVNGVPVVDVPSLIALTGETDSPDVVLGIVNNVIKQAIVRKRPFSYARHRTRYHDTAETAGRAPVYALALAGAAALEREFADAQKSVGQGHVEQVAAPAERAVADRGNCGGELYRDDIPPVAIPRRRIAFLAFLLVSVEEVLHIAFAIDIKRVAGLPMRAGCVEIVFVLDTLAVLVISPEAVGILEAPGQVIAVFTAFALHVMLVIVDVSPLIEGIDVAENFFDAVAFIIRTAVIVTLAGEADVCHSVVVYTGQEFGPAESVAVDPGHAVGNIYCSEGIYDVFVPFSVVSRAAAELERPFADALERVGQLDFAQVVEPAERTVADLGHAVADDKP